MDGEEFGDYYDILGVSKSACTSDIKKAYRKEALKWHPDKNLHDKETAQRRFQKISEAYQVLSDKHKRDVYDRRHAKVLPEEHSESKNEQRYRRQNTNIGSENIYRAFTFKDPGEVFRDFFGGRDPFYNLFANVFGTMDIFGGFNDGMRRPRYDTTPAMLPFRPFGPNTDFDDFFGTGLHGAITNRRNEDPAIESRPKTTTKTTVIYKNNKKITRKVVNENGRETVTEFTEDHQPGRLEQLRAK